MPTEPRTALCSATSPPMEGYSTGISQPPKLTIFAPNRRCKALRGVLRSSLILGEFAASIPHARAEIDTSTRSRTRQRSGWKCRNLRLQPSEQKMQSALRGQLASYCRARACRPMLRSGTVFEEACECPVRSFAASATKSSRNASAKNIVRFARGRIRCGFVPTVYTIAPIAGRLAT